MKSRILTLLGTAAVFVLLTSVSTQTAKADLITTFVSDTAVSGGWNYTYDVGVSALENLTPTGDSSIGGEFGTIYDIGPVTIVSMSSALTADFTFLAQTATNSPAFHTTPVDTALLNLRYMFNGTTTVPGSTDLGDFTVFSTAPPSSVSGFADGQAAVASTGLPTGNIQPVVIPAVGGVPEPASIILMGSGLLGLGFIGRSRLRRKAKL